MTVTINNRAKHAKTKGSHDFYDWEVFVDEPASVMEQIDHVTYFLHKTFPNPVRTADDPEGGFSVKSRGWGEFDIGIKISYKDGREEQEIYRLDLSKPWP